MADIEAGTQAPDFELSRDGGGTVRLSELRGRKVVLYFYPKDDTSGCTVEALAFTAKRDAFGAANTVVLGISRDSVKSHDKFRDKHGLTIALLSDAEGTVTEAYGVWVEKSMYGRSYMGVDRSTFLIDAGGRVAKVWRKVKVPNHVEEVLTAVRAL